MNKSQLISTIKSLQPSQAQLWYDHIFAYTQANKHYPRLRYIGDKTSWANSIDADFGTTVATMTKLGYIKLAYYRMVARALTQYHMLEVPNILRTPSLSGEGEMPKAERFSKIINVNTVLLHNITTGIDISQGDQRYSRNLDSDLNELLG